MLEIVVGSGNPHKVREIREILAGAPVKLLGPDDVGDFPAVEEDGRTLEENAAKKACEIAARLKRFVVADDTGLEVDALGGEPGVESARYAGPECDYAANNRKLLRALEGTPFPQRTAVFRCVIALAGRRGLVFAAEGRCEGMILESPRGRGGFGYDPLFYYPPAAKSFAEMAPGEKNRVSHRSRALQAFGKELLQRLAAGGLAGDSGQEVG